jgi:hypothetical protein
MFSSRQLQLLRSVCARVLASDEESKALELETSPCALLTYGVALSVSVQVGAKPILSSQESHAVAVSASLFRIEGSFLLGESAQIERHRDKVKISGRLHQTRGAWVSKPGGASAKAPEGAHATGSPSHRPRSSIGDSSLSNLSAALSCLGWLWVVWTSFGSAAADELGSSCCFWRRLRAFRPTRLRLRCSRYQLVVRVGIHPHKVQLSRTFGSAISRARGQSPSSRKLISTSITVFTFKMWSSRSGMHS